MAVLTGDNNWAVARFIVNPTAGLGTHTTIQSAIDDASAGDTIFIMNYSYSEDITLKDQVSLTGLLDIQAFQNGPKLTGLITCDNVNANISNVLFTVTTNKGISITNSGALRLWNTHFRSASGPCITMDSGTLHMSNCTERQQSATSAFLSTTGGTVYSYHHKSIDGSTQTTIASTIEDTSLNIYNGHFYQKFTTSGTSSLIAKNCDFTSTGNTFDCGGSGTHIIEEGVITSSNSTPITISDNLTLTNSTVDSNNATAIAGTGTLTYAGLTFVNGSTLTTSTQTLLVEGPSKLIGSINSGNTNSLTVSNPSNTASSASNIVASVGGTSTGDATFQSVVSGGSTWTWGVDNGSSDAFVLSASTSLGTTNVVSSSTAGEINYPLQPSFGAYLNSVITNVTGDGTVYTVIFDNETFDQNGDFNLGTSTFTAPVTGRYLLTYNCTMRNVTAGHTDGRINITTSNNNYQGGLCDPSITSGATSPFLASESMSIIADMDAADTAIFSLTVSGSTLTVGLPAGKNVSCSGQLLA